MWKTSPWTDTYLLIILTLKGKEPGSKDTEKKKQYARAIARKLFLNDEANIADFLKCLRLMCV